jgi:Flp pilus assembly protein TadB
VVAFLFTHPVGVACLILGVGLELVGVLWMARITRSGS